MFLRSDRKYCLELVDWAPLWNILPSACFALLHLAILFLPCSWLEFCYQHVLQSVRAQHGTLILDHSCLRLVELLYLFSFFLQLFFNAMSNFLYAASSFRCSFSILPGFFLIWFPLFWSLNGMSLQISSVLCLCLLYVRWQLLHIPSFHL